MEPITILEEKLIEGDTPGGFSKLFTALIMSEEQTGMDSIFPLVCILKRTEYSSSSLELTYLYIQSNFWKFILYSISMNAVLLEPRGRQLLGEKIAENCCYMLSRK